MKTKNILQKIWENVIDLISHRHSVTINITKYTNNMPVDGYEVSGVAYCEKCDKEIYYTVVLK